MNHRSATASILLALLLLAGACSGDDDDGAQVSLSYAESPINELLGIDIALRSSDLVELERSAERGVVECMKQSGFEYVPVDFAAQLDTDLAFEDPDSRGYAEVNGYGISVRPEINTIDPDDFIDPNDAIRASLSDAERDSYQLALYGEAPVEGEQVSLADRTGCVAESYRTVYAAQAELGAVEKFFGDFAGELAELEERFRGDLRFVALEEQWATCMAERGYNVATRQDIFVQLNDRMSEVTGPVAAPGDEPVPEVQAQLDEVADWERSVAVADWDCTQPVDDDMRALRYGYEALFLEENAGRLAE